MVSASGPVSRRERPAKPALSRRWIVDTAVRVMRSEGLDKVTMRRLAKELDTGPASLYVYVSSTAELHAAVLDALLGEVDLAAEDAGPGWREQLIGVLTSYTLTLMEHPQLARSALVARPSERNYLNLVERILDLLARSGAPREQVAWGVDALLQYATAAAAEHGTQRRSPSHEADMSALRRTLQDADDATHPAIKAHLPELISGPKGRLAWGFAALINGVVHTPLPER
ncbi:TetR/AcrR family transcriptional regulator [Amycolatopsis thermoflava]|uniref:TetR/AcrR family transcriptional regulator n=1 Tax=Amycolatopsis thermoflava TaxID=84480 RepID=UPI00364DB8C2